MLKKLYFAMVPLSIRKSLKLDRKIQVLRRKTKYLLTSARLMLSLSPKKQLKKIKFEVHLADHFETS